MPTPKTARRSPPFRAEHLGSLKRPEDLLKKREEVNEGAASEADLPAIEDTAIQDAVKRQLELGFRGVSDGEYRRHMFWGTFFPNLAGMTQIERPSITMFRTYLPDVAAFMENSEIPGETVVCTGPIQHTGKSTLVGQLQYLQTLLPPERHGDIKLTLPAPEWYHLRYREGQAYPEDVYPDDAAYFKDLAAAYRTELDILYAAGLRNAQIDDPNFAYFCSEKMLEGWAADTSNKYTPDELLDSYIAFYNDCLSTVPADLHVGLHICRGNFVNSRHFSSGGYDRIATRLFQNLHVDTYYLEYDTPRAGGFEPLKEVPPNKNVILGVVTSKFPELEDKGEMKRRVYQAADLMAEGAGTSREDALQRLGASPQCGFASHAKGNLLGREDMWKKLKLVREIADEVWPGES
ncbi:MAG: hypothetical protein M1831_004720 [Alyxoria varia]|nr:MAG: hypothetical protein M1831_004720 [Alyxoria varia]